MRKAVILFSGGLDSTTCVAIAKEQGFIPYALSFSYGQRHNAELDAAAKIANIMGVMEHRVVNIDIAQFGGSALTDSALDVPDYQEDVSIPITYVPGRNTIFLSVALSFAETIGAADIFIGANHADYEKYPDCRPEFIEAFTKLANVATKIGVEGNDIKIHAPLLMLDKSEIIARGLKLGVNYADTKSCYRLDNKGAACGSCDSCVIRQEGFAKAGKVDPTLYIVD